MNSSGHEHLLGPDENRPPEAAAISTRILSRKHGVRIIELSADRFYEINEETRTEMGSTLSELSETEPVKAYDYLRQVIGISASRHALHVEVDGGMVTHRDINGEKETRSDAERIVFEHLPGSFSGNINVSVRIPPTEMDRALGIDEAITVLQFHITPESLAS